MSQPARICFGRGMLVSNAHWIPTDLIEYGATDSILPAVGCNALRCNACGEHVRVFHGLSVPFAAATPSPQTLFGAQDPLSLSGISQEQSANLYACRCRTHTERNTQYLDDDDPLHSLSLPWACVGHPAPPTPFTLDGDLISLSPLAPLVGDLLCARRPLGVHPAIASLAGFQAVRVFRLIEDPTQRLDFDACVAQHLTDPDPLTRRGALGFYRLFPANPGVRALLAVQKKRSLWSPPDPTDPRVTLQHTHRLTLDAIQRHDFFPE